MKRAPQPVPLAKSYLLLNHGPVTLVTSAHGERRNVMSASWAMPLDFDPPKVLLVVDRQTYTRQLIDASGEFALNLPCRSLADKALAAGSISGRDLAGSDKFSRIGFETFPASRIAAPLVAGCAAWLECRVLPEPANEKRYDLFIAEVLAAWADQEIFSEGRWHFSDDKQKTIHYQAGGMFFETGDPFECREPAVQ